MLGNKRLGVTRYIKIRFLNSKNVFSVVKIGIKILSTLSKHCLFEKYI